MNRRKVVQGRPLELGDLTMVVACMYVGMLEELPVVGQERNWRFDYLRRRSTYELSPKRACTFVSWYHCMTAAKAILRFGYSSV